MNKFILITLLISSCVAKGQTYNYGVFLDSVFEVKKYSYTDKKLSLQTSNTYHLNANNIYMNGKEYNFKPNRTASYRKTDSIKTYNSFIKQHLIYPYSNLNIKINFGFYIFISATGEIDEIFIVYREGDKSFRMKYMINARKVLLKSINNWKPAINNFKKVNSVLLVSVVYNGTSFCNCRE